MKPFNYIVKLKISGVHVMFPNALIVHYHIIKDHDP